MAELIDIFKAITHKADWSRISDDDKIKNFFIINRYISKKYLEKSKLFNLKTIDKVSAMNIWHYFMLEEPYPNWFWSKTDKKEESKLSKKEYSSLLFKLKIINKDLDYLIENHFDFIKEELKFIKDIEKYNK